MFLTPIHLLGIDFYNFQNKQFSERIKYLKPVYLPSVGIRMVRMSAAYGIGGVNNRKFRNMLISRIEGLDWDNSYSKKVLN